MRPPKRSAINYERIKVYDEWVKGTIDEIQLEENRATGFNDEKTGEPKFADMVRFKFTLEGHQYPHRSRWMSYSFGEKANLYNKYLAYLVEGAEPDMEFDLDHLNGFKVKTMWVQKGDFDNLEAVRPLEAKFPYKKDRVEPEEPPEEVLTQTDTEIQF